MIKDDKKMIKENYIPIILCGADPGHVCVSHPESVGVGSTSPFPTPSSSLLSLSNKALEKIFVTGLRDFLPEFLIKWKNQMKTEN